MKRLFFVPVSLLLMSCVSIPEQDKIAATEKCEALFSEAEKQSCFQTLTVTDDYAKYTSAQNLSDAETARYEKRRRELAIGVPEKNAGGFMLPRPDE